jgi:hypothetical protein
VGKMVEAEANGGPLLGRMLGPYGVLRGNQNLQLLFDGQVVSTFGDWLYILALVVLAYDLAGSATLVAALTFVRLLPYALFLPFSGVLADRGNRKGRHATLSLQFFRQVRMRRPARASSTCPPHMPSPMPLRPARRGWRPGIARNGGTLLGLLGSGR